MTFERRRTAYSLRSSGSNEISMSEIQEPIEIIPSLAKSRRVRIPLTMNFQGQVRKGPPLPSPLLLRRRGRRLRRVGGSWVQCAKAYLSEFSPLNLRSSSSSFSSSPRSHCPDFEEEDENEDEEEHAGSAGAPAGGLLVFKTRRRGRRRSQLTSLLHLISMVHDEAVAGVIA